MSESNVSFRAYISPEDQGRANLYALLARLFADAPDTDLLKAIASAAPMATEDVGAPLAQAWSNMIAMASVADEDAMREEFDALFVGIGKAPLNLHASHHLTGFMMEKPLAAVREHNAKLGLAMNSAFGHVDDHLSCLCEAMRALIAGFEGFPAKSINVQREYFDEHLSPWFGQCFNSILKSPLANLYKSVGQFANEYLLLEQEQFALSST